MVIRSPLRRVLGHERSPITLDLYIRRTDNRDHAATLPDDGAWPDDAVETE
jgi:hypothetical protein